MTSRAIAAAALLAAGLAACRSSQRTPEPPRPAAVPFEELVESGPPELQPYLDAYPLGVSGLRTDLVASDGTRSMHFVQFRRGLARHSHPERTETVYVLTGTGTCYIADRSYPIGPGSTFRIAPGVPHSALPADGQTIVAVCYLEPPLPEGEDDRITAE